MHACTYSCTMEHRFDCAIYYPLCNVPLGLCIQCCFREGTQWQQLSLHHKIANAPHQILLILSYGRTALLLKHTP